MMGLCSLVTLEWRFAANQYKIIPTDHVYAIMKISILMGAVSCRMIMSLITDLQALLDGLLQIHSDTVLTDFLWDILEQSIRQCFPSPPLKHQLREYLSEEWCSFLGTVPETCSVSEPALEAFGITPHFVLLFFFSWLSLCFWYLVSYEDGLLPDKNVTQNCSVSSVTHYSFMYLPLSFVSQS